MRTIETKVIMVLLRLRTHGNFSCVFVLFQVMSLLFSIPLRTVNNTKTQENFSLCTGSQAPVTLHIIMIRYQKNRLPIKYMLAVTLVRYVANDFFGIVIVYSVTWDFTLTFSLEQFLFLKYILFVVFASSVMHYIVLQ